VSCRLNSKSKLRILRIRAVDLPFRTWVCHARRP
jgi:hypothetical protein